MISSYFKYCVPFAEASVVGFNIVFCNLGKGQCNSIVLVSVGYSDIILAVN